MNVYIYLHADVHPIFLSDLGVYIDGMEPGCFAARSGKLMIHDRILACNGVDFTKESNSR